MLRERIDPMDDEGGAVGAGERAGTMADGKAVPATSEGGGESVEGDGLGQGEESDGLDGAQWDGAAEAVVEVPEADAEPGPEDGGEGIAEGAGMGKTVAEAGEEGAGDAAADGPDGSGGGKGGATVNPAELEEQASDAGSGSGQAEQGAASGGRPANEGGGDGAARREDGEGRKAATGGMAEGAEDGDAGGLEGERAEAVAPTSALSAVDEEVRAGLGRVEGQLGAVVKLVEGLKASSAKDGEREALGEIQKDIARQADVLGSTMKKVEAVTGRVEEKVDAASEAIEEGFGNVDALASVGKGMERLEAAMMAYSGDLNRRIKSVSGPQRWAAIAAVAVAAPACVVAGAFVEHEWRVLPIEDSTGGWRGHVWDNYGKDIVGCVQQAYRDRSSYSCVVDVRKSVEQVRGSAGR